MILYLFIFIVCCSTSPPVAPGCNPCCVRTRVCQPASLSRSSPRAERHCDGYLVLQVKHLLFSVFINHELDWPVLWVNCALFSCSDTRRCILKVAPWNLTQFAQIEKIRRVNPVSFITLADREGQVSEFYFGSSLNSWVPPSKFNLAVSLHISTQANSAHTKCLSCTNIHNPSAINMSYKLFKIPLKKI